MALPDSLAQRLDDGDFPHRDPVIGADAHLDATRLKQEWLRLTELLRRGMREGDPAIANALLSVETLPVTDDLPRIFLEALDRQQDAPAHLQRLRERCRESLEACLRLDPVPANQVRPDLKRAPQLTTRTDAKRSFTNTNSPDPEAEFEKMLQDKEFEKGITDEERRLLKLRMPFARDLKFLALGAELQRIPRLKFSSGEARLPSGVTIGIDPAEREAARSLLSVQTWQSRRRLKDRVYEVRIQGQAGERTYILKERKTKLHEHTMDGGHTDGRTSRKEYETARTFSTEHVAEEDGVHLRWERPVGFVEFPDGFQATVFHADPGLRAKEDRHLLADRIRSHPERHAERMQRLAPRAREILEAASRIQVPPSDPNHYEVPIRMEPADALRCLAAEMRGIAPEAPTFEDYAEARAWRLGERCDELPSEVLFENGYMNGDANGGCAVRLRPGDEDGYDVIGFDFEYVFPMYDAPDAARVQAHRRTKMLLTRSSLFMVPYRDMAPGIKAFCLAMLDEEEQALKP